MAGLSLSISDCTCAKPPSTLLFPLLIQNLHKSHEKKKPEKQGTGKELVLWITHARREFRTALERLFWTSQTQSTIKLWVWKFLCQKTTYCIFLWLKNWKLINPTNNEMSVNSGLSQCSWSGWLCSRARAHRDKLGTRGDGTFPDWLSLRTWKVFRTSPTFSFL